MRGLAIVVLVSLATVGACFTGLGKVRFLSDSFYTSLSFEEGTMRLGGTFLFLPAVKIPVAKKRKMEEGFDPLSAIKNLGIWFGGGCLLGSVPKGDPFVGLCYRGTVVRKVEMTTFFGKRKVAIPIGKYEVGALKFLGSGKLAVVAKGAFGVKVFGVRAKVWADTSGDMGLFYSLKFKKVESFGVWSTGFTSVFLKPGLFVNWLGVAYVDGGIGGVLIDSDGGFAGVVWGREGVEVPLGFHTVLRGVEVFGIFEPLKGRVEVLVERF